MTSRQRVYRSFSTIEIPNPTIFQLRTKDWIPCGDGEKRRPNQIILTRSGSRAFNGTFFNPAIDVNHSLLDSINRRDIDYTLLKLGAIYSLESLRPDDLYRLLLELPNTDPDGKIASSIYRSVIEHGGIDTDSPLKYKFIDEGSMWGALGEIQDYYPVRDLKYSSIGVLPRPVYEMVPLVDIDPRRSTKEIERVFGVSTLRKEDVQIEIQEDYTEYQDWSHIVSNHVKNAIPYLYAFRLSRTADETGREGRIFSRMRLDICQKISANIQLWDKKEGGIIIKGLRFN
jgi:hypothetical protein